MNADIPRSAIVKREVLADRPAGRRIEVAEVIAVFRQAPIASDQLASFTLSAGRRVVHAGAPRSPFKTRLALRKAIAAAPDWMDRQPIHTALMALPRPGTFFQQIIPIACVSQGFCSPWVVAQRIIGCNDPGSHG